MSIIECSLIYLVGQLTVSQNGALDIDFPLNIDLQPNMTRPVVNLMHILGLQNLVLKSSAQYEK